MTRIRSLVLSLGLVIIALVSGAGLAAADDYVPPSVTVLPSSSSSVPATPGTSIEVLGVSRSVDSDLASTGAGFNLGMALTIAAVVLVIGVALIVAGRRVSRRGGHRS